MSWIKPDWPLPDGVQAAVTLRDGGVSQGSYASLNPATHVADDSAAVAENRRIIRQQLGLPSEPVWLQQVHGIEVIKANPAPENAIPHADASYSDQAGTVCAVLTADCLPLLFCSDDGEKIAAAHGGWRGLQAGIIQQTLNALNCSELSVWLGPAIGPQQFEVGDDVRQAFVDNSPIHATAFIVKTPDKWLADIYLLARQQLNALGVDRVYGGDFCTVSDASRFYSYRRDGATTGRMASLIWRSH